MDAGGAAVEQQPKSPSSQDTSEQGFRCGLGCCLHPSEGPPPSREKPPPPPSTASLKPGGAGGAGRDPARGSPGRRAALLHGGGSRVNFGRPLAPFTRRGRSVPPSPTRASACGAVPGGAGGRWGSAALFGKWETGFGKEGERLLPEEIDIP